MKFLMSGFCGAISILIFTIGWDVDIEQVGVFKFVGVWVICNVVLSVPQLFKIS